jgi:GTPase SAR1 family protein
LGNISTKIKTFKIDESLVKLQIWDTAGQERFRALAPMYYRGARAAVVVCGCTDMDSFRRVGSWLDDLERSRPT